MVLLKTDVHYACIICIKCIVGVLKSKVGDRRPAPSACDRTYSLDPCIRLRIPSTTR